MGTTLTGTTPQDTYDSLIKVTDNAPLTGSLKRITDGLGNDSALSLSTAAARVTGNLSVKTTTERANITTDADLVTENGVGVLATSTTFGQGYQYIRFMNSAGAYSGSVSHTASTGIGLYSGSDLILASSSTERMRILAAGNVGIGTTAPTSLLHLEKAAQDNVLAVVGQDTYEGALFLSSAGSGKDANIVIGNSRSLIFYSTANSTPAARGTRILTIDSQGIKFGTDTAAANALDDYEEGTFTPSVEGSTSAGTASYTVQSGNYTKIGRQVSISIDLLWSSGTGTGSLRITGLPFTNISTPNAATIGYIDGITFTALNYATCYIPPSTTRIEFVGTPTGGGSVTDVSYDSAGRIIVTATYFV